MNGHWNEFAKVISAMADTRDVPASEMAPHLVHGRSDKDKEQQASTVPYRDRDHTAWMAEHQIERVCRDRFTRTGSAEEALCQHSDFLTKTITAHAAKPAAWLVAVARPTRPLQRKLRLDSTQQIIATIYASNGPGALEPRTAAFGDGRESTPPYARKPHHIQPVHTLLPPIADDEEATRVAEELSNDLMSQFGL